MGGLGLIICFIPLSVPVKIHPGADHFPDIFKHTLTRAGFPGTFPFRDVSKGADGWVYLVSRPIFRPRKPIS